MSIETIISDPIKYVYIYILVELVVGLVSKAKSIQPCPSVCMNACHDALQSFNIQVQVSILKNVYAYGYYG